MNDEHELLDRTRDWISGIKAQYGSVPLDQDDPLPHEPEPFGFKLL
jgi:hypothetical protein